MLSEGIKDRQSPREVKASILSSSGTPVEGNPEAGVQKEVLEGKRKNHRGTWERGRGWGKKQKVRTHEQCRTKPRCLTWSE